MAKTMTASEGMTDGQIDTLVDHLRAATRKHREEISRESAQYALGLEHLGMILFVAFRGLAEMVSKMIIRVVSVDRSRAPEEFLKATGHRLYLDNSVVATMPRGGGDKTEVVFLKLDLSERDYHILSDDDLDKEYEKYGLRPADPYSVVAVNEADSAFADDHPNCTHWKDGDGKWCGMVFRRWGGERRVSVDRADGVWDDRWWYAGMRK